MRLQWEWGVQQSTQHRTTRVSNNKKALAPISSLNRHIFQQGKSAVGVTITTFIKPESETLNINCSINFLCFDKNQQTQTYKHSSRKNPFIIIWQTKVQQQSKIICFKQNGSHLPPFKEIFYWGKWKNKHTNCPAVTLENMTSISKKNPTQN